MLVMGSTQISIVKLFAPGPSTIQETVQIHNPEEQTKAVPREEGVLHSKRKNGTKFEYGIEHACITSMVNVIQQVELLLKKGKAVLA